MIRNKDGSYNKFSLAILSAIIIIVIGMIASILFQSGSTVDIDTLTTIGLFISGGVLAYYVIKLVFKTQKIKSSMDPITKPEKIQVPTITPSRDYIPSPYIEHKSISEIDKELDESIKAYEKRKTKSGIGINAVSIVITLVIAGVVFYVGSIIAGSVLSAMPTIPEGSPLAATQTELTNTLGTAFNFMGLGILILSIMAIIGFMCSIIRAD